MIAKVLPILLKCQIVTNNYNGIQPRKFLLKIELKKSFSGLQKI